MIAHCTCALPSPFCNTGRLGRYHDHWGNPPQNLFWAMPCRETPLTPQGALAHLCLKSPCADPPWKITQKSALHCQPPRGCHVPRYADPDPMTPDPKPRETNFPRLLLVSLRVRVGPIRHLSMRYGAPVDVGVLVVGIGSSGMCCRLLECALQDYALPMHMFNPHQTDIQTYTPSSNCTAATFWWVVWELVGT